MSALTQRGGRFVTTLKSSAGFAIAAVSLVGVLVAVWGRDPAESELLLHIVAFLGAAAGALFGAATSEK